MPILHRNVVPNVPALTADNGKPCYRGNALSHQCQMQIASLAWTGYVDISSFNMTRQTITKAEMDTALSGIVSYVQSRNKAKFFYGVATPDANHFAEWTQVYAGAWIAAASDVEIGYFDLRLGLYWNPNETSWKWCAQLIQMNVRINEAGTWKYFWPIEANHYARFDSSAQTQDARLGAGRDLYYVGQFTPGSFANGFNGCALTIGAQAA